MSLREQIEKALNTPFDAAKQGLDESKYVGLGVYHDGPTLEKSWVVISRELNTDSGTLTPEGKWIPAPDPTARTSIDIQSDIGQTKGEFKDIVKLKNKFLNLTRNLPEGEYYLHADNPIKAKYYQRVFKDHPWIGPSGEQGGLRVKGEMIKYDTLKLTIPDKEARFAQMQDSSNFRDWRTQGVPMTDLSKDTSDIAQKYDMQYRFNVNNLEGKELRKHASDWLFDNPGKDLGDWAEEFGYKGPRLQQKGLLKNGKPRISWRSIKSDARYNATVKPQTEAEAANLLEEKAKARVLNEDLIHQQLAPETAKGGLHKAQVDHFQYPKGGDPLRRVGVLDAQQNLTKKNAEEIHRSRKTQGITIDIDDVSGETILVPDVTHNPYETHKSRGAVVIPDGADVKTINAAFDQVEINKLKFEGQINRAIGNRFGKWATRSALLGGASVLLTSKEAKARAQEAAEDPSFLNKLQSTIAKVEAGTDVAGLASSATGIGAPIGAVAEGTSLLAGGTNLAIDAGRALSNEQYRENLLRQIGGSVDDSMTRLKQSASWTYQQLINMPK